MANQPLPYFKEFIDYTETYVRPLFTQLKEAYDGLRDSRDDWQRDQQIIYERNMGNLNTRLSNGLAIIDAKAIYSNQRAENAIHRVEKVEGRQDILGGELQSLRGQFQSVQGEFLSHRGSHKLEATEREKALLVASQEKSKTKWTALIEIVKQVAPTLLALAALITALAK